MNSSQTTICCSIIRGGTSRGAYFHVDDLPAVTTVRDAVLRAVIGGPDALQIDGIGGGHPLTNKVAIVGPSTVADADVDYLFLQVSPATQSVSASQNCGNILAGVGPFAIDHGLVKSEAQETVVRVHMVNSGNRCELTVQTPNGVVAYDGAVSIDGVPGEAAPIICDFLDIAGSITGSLLPTGNVTDTVDGISVTCIDNGMPVVVIHASDVGCTGYETPQELEENASLKSILESLRLQLGPTMNIGDVTNLTVPKMCLIAKAAHGGQLSTRTFIPHECHRAVGVMAAVTVATACIIPGTVTDGMAIVPPGQMKVMDIEHPSGALQVRLNVDDQAQPESMIKSAGVVRTARTLLRGEVFVSPQIWDGTH